MMVANDTKQVLEETQELVEDAIELVERRFSWVTREPKAVAILSLGLGLSAGAVLGYFLTKKRISKKYQAEADEQIADVKKHYSILRKEGENGDLEALAAKYEDVPVVTELAAVKDIVAREGYTAYNDIPPAKTVDVVVEDAKNELVQRNVFESDDPDTYFDFAAELLRREEEPDRPFVITKEEFDLNETDYEQVTITYYETDDVLADSQDKPLDDIEAVMGYANLLRFGHGSGDKNVVYIRNSVLGTDLEVLHSDGTYSRDVLGFIEHSDKRPPRKFRHDD